MPWTSEEKLESLLRLPWTIRSADADDPGERVYRVAELPGFVVVGTPEELETSLWDALREFLASFLEHDDPIPLPSGIKRLPWERGTGQQPRVLVEVGRGEAWEIREPPSESAGAGSLVVTAR